MDAAASVLADSAPRLSAVVASAAADWFPPVAALQHVMEDVHSFTGLYWWTSIVPTTLLTETSLYLVPLLVKSTIKYNSVDPRPQVGNKFVELFKKYGVNPSTLKVLKGFTRGSINLSLLLAILNMGDKVPSFKEGGAYWFTDLSTRDDLYILPVLTSMTIWALLELIIRHGMMENRTLQALKVYRVLIVLMIPFITFPKAVLIHMITCNLFSVGHFLALGQPAVRSYLNLPHLAPRRVPAQAQAQPPGYGLSKGPEPIPAVVSPVAVKRSEQSSSEPSDRIMIHACEQEMQGKHVAML